MLVFCVAYAVVVSPWLIRNKEVSGVWGISSVKDFNFFHYYIPEFLSYKRGITPDEGRMLLRKDLGTVSPEQIDDLRYSPLIHSIWMKYVKEDPIGYTKFHLVKTIPFFLSSGIKNVQVSYRRTIETEVFKVSNANMTNYLLKGQFRAFLGELWAYPLVTLEQLFWLILTIFAFLAVFIKKSRSFTVASIIIILYFALLTGSVAYARFRLPAAPFLFLLASFFVFEILKYVPVKNIFKKTV